MSNLVPISMLVTIETVRFLQAYFIMWDIDMCDPKTGVQAFVHSSSLNESLGMVNYVFTDKTGTLTQNCMEFKKVSFGKYTYGMDKGLQAMTFESDCQR